MYRDAFGKVLAGDPDYYDDDEVDEMMAELAKPTHVPWFQQAYCKFVEGQRFASQILVLEHTLVSLLGTEIKALNLENLIDKILMIRAGSLQRR